MEAAEKDPNSLLNFYRKLLALRKEYKDAAVYGRFEIKLKGDKNLFVYEKLAEDGSKLTVILNVGEKGVPCRKVKKFIPENSTEIISVYNGRFAEVIRRLTLRVSESPSEVCRFIHLTHFV